MNNLSEILHEILSHVGLDKFKCDVIATDFKHSYVVHLRYEIPGQEVHDLSKDMNKSIKSLFDPIAESVQNSSFVKEQIAEYKNKAEEAERLKDLALAEIVKLQKFETHYNLAYKMTHGESNE